MERQEMVELPKKEYDELMSVNDANHKLLAIVLKKELEIGHLNKQLLEAKYAPSK